MLVRAHILVSGRVQGVFFRDSTQKWASALGLSGWVRNLPDGRVEVIAEGNKNRVLNLIEKIKQGPPSADVDSTEIEWEDYRGEFNDFRIVW